MKIPKDIEVWFASRTAGKVMRLKTACRFTEEYRRHTGGKDIYGKVVLSASPSDEFRFISYATWPDARSKEEMEDYVVSAILRRVLLEEYFPVLGLRIVLEDVGWDAVNSCAIGYYLATEAAIGRIVRPDPLTQNFEEMKAAEPGATDNPDDAQRLREDH